MNNQTKKLRSFTLIEILMVIGIIGILLSILIMSSVSAKNKTKDVAIKNIMNEPLTAFSIEYYLSHNSNYGAFCNQPEVIDFLSQINSADTECNTNEQDTYPVSKICCHHNANIWVVCAQLYSSSNKTWCSDSAGARKEIDIDTCKQSMTSCNDI